MRHQHPLTAPLTSSSSPILDNLYLSRLHSTSSSTFCSYIDTFQLLTFIGLMMVKLQIPKNDLMVLPRFEIIAHSKHRACHAGLRKRVALSIAASFKGVSEINFPFEWLQSEFSLIFFNLSSYIFCHQKRSNNIYLPDIYFACDIKSSSRKCFLETM